MPVALVTNSTHVFAHPPASPPESQVTHALGCVTHSRAHTSGKKKKKNGRGKMARMASNIHTTRADWLKIKKKGEKKCSVAHPDALLFFISPLVYSEPSADFPEDM